ncbi:hypothetical protein [Bacillus velezensis]|uniref:hypothetical protein n=1 Tax=Bacillus velezensis TaxID=492670 RepID=UPI0013D24A1B|nr:hypothetical protein [Bacillus velezensis]
MIESHCPDCDYKKFDLEIRADACCPHCGRVMGAEEGIGIEAFAAKDMVKYEEIISIERDSGVESGGLFGPEKKKDYYVFVTTSLKETRVPKEQVTIKFTKVTPYYEKKEFCKPLWDGVINWNMPSIAVEGYDEFTIKINKAMMKKLYD